LAGKPKVESHEETKTPDGDEEVSYERRPRPVGDEEVSYERRPRPVGDEVQILKR